MSNKFLISEQALLTAIELNPKAINAYNDLIGIYFALGKGDTNAKIIHDKGVLYNKNNVSIRIRYLGFMLPKWGVDPKIRMEYIAEIEKLAMKRSNLIEVLIDNYSLLADEVTDYNDAMALYSKSFEYGYRCRTHVSRTLKLYNFKYYTYALNDLNELIKRCPDNASAYLIKARTLYKLDDFNEALINFDLALKLVPDGPQIIGTRGFIYYLEKEYERAIDDLSVAIRGDAGTSWMWLNRGKSYKKIKQYDKAIYDFGRAIQLNPGNVNNYKLRAYCYKKLQQYELALKDYNKGLVIDERNTKLLFLRAKLNYGVFSDVNAALVDLEKAIYFDPENKKAMKLLYKIKNKMNI